MYTTQLYFPTLKETPADAELISHKLMLRAGMIRRLAAGLYVWLPLGIRTLRKGPPWPALDAFMRGIGGP